MSAKKFRTTVPQKHRNEGIIIPLQFVSETPDRHAKETGIIDKYSPLIGEFAWHNITIDPTIESVSEQHFKLVCDVLKKHGLWNELEGLRILEVASYAHTTGYRLAKFGAKVTLFDISAKTLELGHKIADETVQNGDVRRVAGDFHNLPFEDETFDFVFICSALHHTLRWKEVLDEMIRVLAPNALLFVENEPCLRKACFYGFRTNREDAFTPFEKELHSSGVLRTFTEPYPGSRPETLFGMIENQQIPLDELLGEMSRKANILELELKPESCMGKLEHDWIKAQKTSKQELSCVIADSLIIKGKRALKVMSEKDRGLGFKVPGNEEIDALAQKVARLIKELPESEGSLEYRIGLSNIFGAPVRSILKKKTFSGEEQWPKKDEHGSFNRKSLLHNGVYYCFAEDLSKILIDSSSLLPSIENDDPDSIAEAFPTEDWSYQKHSNSVRALALNSRKGEIRISTKGLNILVLLRLYVAESTSGGYNVCIYHREKRIFSYDVWQSDSILFAEVIEVEGGKDLTLHVEKMPLVNSTKQSAVGVVLVNYAAAFEL
jgi:ubiquinone/menaquinone biosynthesis C-methylase UbiE